MSGNFLTESGSNAGDRRARKRFLLNDVEIDRQQEENLLRDFKRRKRRRWHLGTVDVSMFNSSGPWPRFSSGPWREIVSTILVVLVVSLANPAVALKNEFLPIQKLCERNHQSFLSNIPRPIDGAVVASNNERDVNCVVTFQTESILERFMLRFEELKLDCNDNLLIFDGAHAIGNHKANLSCDKTPDTFGNGGFLFSRTNYITLKFVSDSWGTDTHGYKMVITAFKDAEKNGCRDGFQCEANGLCIDNDLVCDNVNHCGDGEDEKSSQFCSLKRGGALFSAIMSTGRICPCSDKLMAAIEGDDLGPPPNPDGTEAEVEDTYYDDNPEEDEIDLTDEVSKWTKGKHRRNNKAIGLPYWLRDDSTLSVAIIVAVVIVIVGLTIAIAIVKVREFRDRQEAFQARTAAYQMTAAKGLNGNAPAMYTSGATTTLLPSAGNTNGLNGGGGQGRPPPPPHANNPQSSTKFNFESANPSSLMATGNTHNLFGSSPPFQDDPFAESSMALTSLVDNAGNAAHPAARRGSQIMQQTMRIIPTTQTVTAPTVQHLTARCVHKETAQGITHSPEATTILLFRVLTTALSNAKETLQRVLCLQVV